MPLFSVAATAVVDKCAAFNGQDLANTVWAYAVVLLRHQPLLDAAADRGREIINDFEP